MNVRKNERLLPTVIVAAILCVTILVFMQVAGHDFLLYDDDVFVVNNTAIQQGLTAESVAWAFTNDHAALWLPATWLSHMVDHMLFGLDPQGHHLMNLWLHLVNTVLTFVVVRRLTGSTWRSGFVAALFAWHPLHVESVAWVTERKDTLSTAFFLLTVLSYQRYVLVPSVRRYLWIFCALMIGLMAKPVLVITPLVLLLLDYWPLRRCTRPDGTCDRSRLAPLLKEKIPLFALCAAVAAATLIMGQRGEIIASLDLVSPTTRIMNALVSGLDYLGKLFWPVSLYAHYPMTVPVPAAATVLATLALGGVTVTAVMTRREQPYLLTGWLWFLATMLPVAGLVQQGSHAMADRYTYLSLTGLFLAMTWGVCELASRFRVPRPVLTLAALVALAGLGVQSHRQVGFWSNTVTLFERSIAVNAANPVALTFLGQGYAASGDTTAAALSYRRAIALSPQHHRAHYNLARQLAAAGEATAAAYHFRAALPRFQQEAGIHVDLANQLWLTSQHEAAASHYEQALRLQPGHPSATTNLALIYLDLASADTTLYERSVQLLRELEREHPDDPSVHYNMACVRSRQGRTHDALEALNRAVAAGFEDLRTIPVDPDLVNLRTSPEYGEWAERLLPSPR